MPRQIFEFDTRKAASNLKKHGGPFREAMTIFDDPLAQTFPDALHSEDEDRSITIGLSLGQRLIFLSNLETESRIRIIGACLAKASERKAYEDLKARS